ncbi:hypothetical protein HYS93_00785 [Candidatus Daviesbacteria bacterium]|nr:hypothetical protein [Candidatus Daviesbacteria bacterium]
MAIPENNQDLAVRRAIEEIDLDTGFLRPGQVGRNNDLLGSFRDLPTVAELARDVRSARLAAARLVRVQPKSSGQNPDSEFSPAAPAAFKPIEDATNDALDVISAIYLRLSDSKRNRFQALCYRERDLKNLSKAVAVRINKDRDIQDSDSRKEVDRQRLLMAGTMFLLIDTIDQLAAFSKDPADLEAVRQAATTVKMANANWLYVAHQGLSLRDFINESVDFRGSPARQLGFLVDLLTFYETGLETQLIAENQHYPFTLYPPSIELNVNFAHNLVGAMLRFASDERGFPTAGLKGLEREAGERARKLVDKVIRFRKRFEAVIFNTRHPDYPSLRAKMLGYLSMSGMTAFAALFTAGVSEAGTVLAFYRRSNTQIEAGYDPEFYSKFAEKLESYGREVVPDSEVLTDDKLVLIYQDDPSRVEPPNDILLPQIVLGLRRATRDREFIITGEEIDRITHPNLARPTRIRFNLDPTKSEVFAVEFIYQREGSGEIIKLYCKYDMNQGVMRWNVLGGVVRELGDYRRRFAYFATDAVISIVNYLQDKYVPGKPETEVVRQVETAALSLGKRQVAAFRLSEDARSKEKKPGAARSQVLTPVQQVLNKGRKAESEQPEGPRRFLIDRKGFKRDLQGYPQPIQVRIKETLRRYLEEGVGEVSSLNTRDNGRTILSLHINVINRRGLRVALEVLTRPGEVGFRYILMAPRDEVYRRLAALGLAINSSKMSR